MIDRKTPNRGIDENSMFETDVPNSTLDYLGLLEMSNGGFPFRRKKIFISLSDGMEVEDRGKWDLLYQL